MISLFEFQARRIERMAASLADFMSTTAPDRLDWCPATDANSQTRSVMAQVSECVSVNRYCAALLRGETPEQIPGRDGVPPITFSDREDAEGQLIASGRELAGAVRALDAEALTRHYPHWRGPLAGELIIEMPYRNMAYHAGQVNMIQLLSGDTEFHLPPTWL
jgi:hypothetical protein